MSYLLIKTIPAPAAKVILVPVKNLYRQVLMPSTCTQITSRINLHMQVLLPSTCKKITSETICLLYSFSVLFSITAYEATITESLFFHKV